MHANKRLFSIVADSNHVLNVLVISAIVVQEFLGPRYR